MFDDSIPNLFTVKHSLAIVSSHSQWRRSIKTPPKGPFLIQNINNLKYLLLDTEILDSDTLYPRTKTHTTLYHSWESSITKYPQALTPNLGQIHSSQPTITLLHSSAPTLKYRKYLEYLPLSQGA